MRLGGNRPPLVEAAEAATEDAVRTLLQKKVNVNAPKRTAPRRFIGRAIGTIWKAPTC